MKRFYRQAGVAEDDAGYVVTLDARQLKTPAKAPLVLPTRALAQAIADEWAAQEGEVRPAAMPLMQLAATAIDRVAKLRGQVAAEVAAYATSDLVCHRAERPPELVARQEAAWQPLVAWAARQLDARLEVAAGVMPLAQPAEALAAVSTAVEAHDDLELTALHSATLACGSVIIALALSAGEIDAGGAWTASQIDESWQIERWGEEAEAMARREALRAEIEAAARFLDLGRG